MAIPEVCDRCQTFPPNAMVSMLDDGTTRCWCWPCVAAVADAVIEELTGGAGEPEPEPEPEQVPEPAPPEPIGEGHGREGPKRSRQQKPEPAASEGQPEDSPEAAALGE